MKQFYTLIILLYALAFGANTTFAQTADFSASVTSGCNPLVVTFTDKSTGTSSSTIYSWDFGDFK
ncbi:MAG: hypothetical protein IT256_01110, partial [Chitinophagaceae bacterium]|nr:hypothetical protein [Chitinophagaceae bacterium]